MKYIVFDDLSRTRPEIIINDESRSSGSIGEMVRMIAEEGAEIIVIFEFGGISRYPEAYEAVHRLNRLRARYQGQRTVRLAYGTWLETDDEEYGNILLAARNGSSNYGLYKLITESYGRKQGGRPLLHAADAAAAKEDVFNYRFSKESDLPDVKDLEIVYSAIGEHRPYPRDKFMPQIADPGKLREECFEAAGKIYGDPLPEAVRSRLEAEVNAITGNGYADYFHAARLISDQAREDQYPIGFRGTVGSSLAAYVLGITEVDPLPPHYSCPDCGVYEEAEGETPFELPERTCPRCGKQMKRSGFRIPYEPFFGYHLDREPSIFFNIAPEFKETAINTLKQTFGESNVIFGGNGHGRVHPGAVLISPDKPDAFEFTPLKRVKVGSNVELITQLSAMGLDVPLMRIDLLGLDCLGKLKRLHELTGVSPSDITEFDEDVLRIFSGEDAKATSDIPEFGSKFTQMLLEKFRPHTAAELIRISGISHGTGTWFDNAEQLIHENKADLMSMISTRDDIMNYLMSLGVEENDAYMIMERIRKGRLLKDDQIQIMKEAGVPEWYITSCGQIRYVFPRSHVVVYTMMALRFAWYKIHYPEPFAEVMNK